MWRYLAISSMVLGSGLSYASFDQDIDAIKSMAGCYEVQFSFEETETAEGVTPSKPYFTKGVEWVSLEERDNKTISLQHILMIGSFYQIKHWRQEWSYEAPQGLEYQGFNTWAQKDFDVQEGAWVQRVFQVDDGPRYECSSQWMHDENSSWSCQTWAPLPRREYSKRSDYDVLDRKNTHVVMADGWLHQQDNEKLQVPSSGDNVWLGSELGVNTYTKIDDSRCAKAKSWWSLERSSVWKSVQIAWENTFLENRQITIRDGSELMNKLNKFVDDELNQNQPTEANKVVELAQAIIAGHLN